MTSYIRAGTRRSVRLRSRGRCEYCGITEVDSDQELQVDHVIAEQHGGEHERDNLAFCCGDCNRAKGPNVATFDPRTGELVPLFHPRRQQWDDHSRREGARIFGLTGIGRGTVRLLKMNDALRIAEREGGEDA